MHQDLLEKLAKLCELPGPTGREEKVLEFVTEELSRFMDVSTDQVGNVVSTLPGKQQHSWIISAHADEIGYLIRSIEDDGFLRLAFNTGAEVPDTRFLPGQQLKILTDTDNYVIGVVGLKSGHLAGKEGKKVLPKMSSLYLEIGANSAEEVKDDFGVAIGNPVVFDTRTRLLGKDDNFAYGKAMDDRSGLLVLLELAERLSEIPRSSRPTLRLVCTVQEEIGVKGVHSIASYLRSEGVVSKVVCVDVGPVGDTPGTAKLATPHLNKGPIIVVKDSMMHYDRQLVLGLTRTANKYDIPVQRCVYENYGSDAVGFFSSGGFPSSLVAIPCRYTHTPFEMISLRDLIATIELLSKFVSNKLW